MPLPVTVPNTFANATTSIPLSQLDANFSTLANAVNDINSGATTLVNLKASNVTITGGNISNVTLDNVTVQTENFDNVTLSNVTITSGNATFTNVTCTTANATTGNITTVNATTVDTTNIEVTNVKAKDGTAAIAIADSTGVTTQSTPAIISVNSASDALRITQIGAGNALVVEDSANPDSTPFVVRADGKVGIGTTTPENFNGYLTAFGGVIESVADDSSGGLQGTRASDNSGSSNWYFNKSRGTNASKTIVQVGDSLGILNWRGYDGASNVLGATIAAEVDGTPGTNDMPGRLVFSTTADGASSPTERMRINNAGKVLIGNTAATTTSLRVQNNISGGTIAESVYSAGAIQSDVTTTARYFRTFGNTAAASFTLGSMIHYGAEQGTIGATSAVTNQYGFIAESSLTGATNNYGFYSDIASGTGRWNFYANGTANNYFEGSIGIGSTSLTNRNLRVAKSLTGSTAGISVYGVHTVNSDVTSSAVTFQSEPSTQAASFTLSSLYHFYAAQGTIGATSAVTDQYGFAVANSLTGATNNYGFYSNIASGTGRWNFYAAGTASNYFAGNVGIGTTSLTQFNLRVTNNITGSTSSQAIRADGVVQSDVTVDAVYYVANAGTANASFTLPSISHFVAQQGTFGASSTVTNQYGFFVSSNLTGATNNYAFYSNIASAANRWNLYMGGTALNYLSGGLTRGQSTTMQTVAGVSNQGFQQWGGGESAIVLGRADNNANGTAIRLLKTRNATPGSYTIVTSGDSIGGLRGFADNGVTYTSEVASVIFNVEGTVSSTATPGNIVFATTRAGNVSTTESMRITSAGNTKIGGTADRATTEGTNQLVLFDGTAPVGTLANGVSFYSASGEARVMDAAGNSTLLSPHDSVTNEWIFHSKHTPSGKVLKIDVEKMLRFINDHFGLDMVHEFTEGE